jgi:hypothetical protein
MVAVKQIRLVWFRGDEITQLMQEVDEVKHLSHPNIIKCEGVDRHDDTLNIVLECVLHSFFLLGFGASFVIAYPLTCCVALRVGMPQTGRLSRCSRSLES